MSKSEMGAKIENAFHSIGVEEGFRRGFNRPNLEFDVKTFELHRDVARANDAGMRDLLNNGWWLTDKIICPPFVTVIFSREKETEEK
jgi:hypothetical protein